MSTGAAIFLIANILFFVMNIVVAYGSYQDFKKVRRIPWTGVHTNMFGVFVNDDTRPGIVAHEKIHFWMGAAWWKTIISRFGWLPFYPYFGFWVSLLAMVGVYIGVNFFMEFAADLGAILWKGWHETATAIAQFHMDTIRGEHGWPYVMFLLATLVGMLFFTPWRLFFFLERN